MIKRKFIVTGLTVFTIFFVVFSGCGIYLYCSTDLDIERLKDCPNLVVRDRYNRELRFYPDEACERHLWIDLDKIPEQLIQAFLAAEDSRFYIHRGYDLTAVARAVKDNLSAGRRVSGASTITQQTIKLLYPSRRTYRNKFVELIRSIKLERCVSKNTIMTQYLNLIYMGNNLKGVNLAARTYFGKTCEFLTTSECAVLRVNFWPEKTGFSPGC